MDLAQKAPRVYQAFQEILQKKTSKSCLPLFR